MTLPALLTEYGVELTLQRRDRCWSAKTTPGRRGAPYPKPWFAVYSAMSYLRRTDLPTEGVSAIWVKLSDDSAQTLLGEAGEAGEVGEEGADQ